MAKLAGASHLTMYKSVREQKLGIKCSEWYSIVTTVVQ